MLAGDPRPHRRAGSCTDTHGNERVPRACSGDASRLVTALVRCECSTSTQAQRLQLTLNRSRLSTHLATSASAALPATRRPRPQRSLSNPPSHPVRGGASRGGRPSPRLTRRRARPATLRSPLALPQPSGGARQCWPVIPGPIVEQDPQEMQQINRIFCTMYRNLCKIVYISLYILHRWKFLYISTVLQTTSKRGNYDSAGPRTR